MMKPLFHRKHDPRADPAWVLWRWFDIVSDREPGVVYLRRLYILRCPWFSVMLHRIFLPDPDRHLHDHPWWFASFILRGSYWEQRFQQAFLFERRWFNFCRADQAHQIVAVEHPCLTLVVTGPKSRSWGFHTPSGWVHWRDYVSGVKP